MLDPSPAEPLEEGNVLAGYSMERFEHGIPAQTRRPSNRPFGKEEIRPRAERQGAGITRTGSSSSSSSGAPPTSSRGSSDESDDNHHDDALAARLIGHTHCFRNHVGDRLDAMHDSSAAHEEDVRQLRSSQLDDIFPPISAPAFTPADAGMNCIQVISADGMDPNHVPSPLRNLSAINVKLFDPRSIGLVADELLRPESANQREIHSLQQEITELAEDKRLLLAKNDVLEKEKHALAASLMKALQDIGEVALSIAERISPSNGKIRGHRMESDMQHLSYLQDSKSGCAMSQASEQDAEVRIIKEELGELRTQNSCLMIEMASARAQKEVLENEVQRIKEAAVRAGREVADERVHLLKEVEGIKSAMHRIREDEKRLSSEIMRLRKDMGAVRDSLEKFDAKEAAVQGEKKQASIEASPRETERSDALTQAASAVDGHHKAAERAYTAEPSFLELHQAVEGLHFKVILHSLPLMKLTHASKVEEVLKFLADCFRQPSLNGFDCL